MNEAVSKNSIMHDKGGGGQKPPNLCEVIYGCPLTNLKGLHRHSLETIKFQRNFSGDWWLNVMALVLNLGD